MGGREVDLSGYFDANRRNWDERVPIHAASRSYDVEGWLAQRPGPPAWQREVLGDIAGLDVVHLQCHFGMDTLSLADLGARVTGLDFSPVAIAEARSLAERAGLSDRATFVEADVHRAVEVLGAGRFDLVYVSLGALCWLPRVDRWAEQVAGLLRPGGRAYLHESHPLSWALAEEELVVEHTFFEEPDPYVDDADVTYTDGDGRLTSTITYEWNHSIGEVVTAVLAQGLSLEALVEHDWTVWPRFPWLVPGDQGRWHMPPDRPRIPLSFTLVAAAPGRGSR